MEDDTASAAAAVESGVGEGEHAGERDRLGSQQQPHQHQQQPQQGQKKRQLLEGDAGMKEEEEDDDSKEQRRRKTACTRCRDSKARCDNSFPCGRCFKFCLDCRPQYSPELLLKEEEEEKDGEEEKGEGGRGGKPTKKRHQQEEKGQKLHGRHRLQCGCKTTTTTKPSFLVNLAIQSNTPRGMVDGYLKAFYELHQEGVVDRGLVIKSIRMWRSRSILVGADISWGISAELCQMLSLSPTDLEVPEDLLLDRPIDMIRAKAQAAQYETTLRDSESLMATAAYYSLAKPEQMAAVMVRIEQDRFSIATNAACRRLFRDANELINDHYERKTIVALVMGALVCPEDRSLWFKTLQRSLFCTATTMYSELIKVYNRDGQISLYLLYTRHIEGAHTVALDPAPRSRYIRPNPEERGVVNRFRLVRPIEDQGCAGRGRIKGKERGKGKEDEEMHASACAPSMSQSSPSLSSFPSLLDPSTLLSFSSLLPGPSSSSSSSSSSSFSFPPSSTPSSVKPYAAPDSFPPPPSFPLDGVRPIAHFPLGLDASNLALQNEASFTAFAFDSHPNTNIFPSSSHLLRSALALPPPLLPALPRKRVTLTAEERERIEAARRLHRAEMRRRTRRLARERQQHQQQQQQQQQQQWGEEQEGKEEQDENEHQQEEEKACRAVESEEEREGEGGDGPSRLAVPAFPSSSRSFLGVMEGLPAVISVQPPPAPFWESPDLCLGPVPVLDEIPGALDMFENDGGLAVFVEDNVEEEEEEVEEAEEVSYTFEDKGKDKAGWSRERAK